MFRSLSRHCRAGSRLLNASLAALFCCAAMAVAQRDVPLSIVNNSGLPDEDFYIGVVGIVNGQHSWIDPVTSVVHTMSADDNTVSGPVINGNMGPGGAGKYADCFTRLSDIPNKSITVHEIYGMKVFIGFGEQLYLYFFGGTGGYAGIDLANPTDPNQGLRYEVVEISNAPNGMWINNTRVDVFQFPMGVEIEGENSVYGKAGELMEHADVVDAWKNSVSSAFTNCLEEPMGIIHAPSKIADFKDGGAQANFFDSYVNDIWNKYTNEDLIFSAGVNVQWIGRVSGDQFAFHQSGSTDYAYIQGRPSTQEVLEGKDLLAQGTGVDKMIQAQICAAINRHAIDLTAGSGTVQDFSDTANYYKTAPYNEYAEFWHRADMSWTRHSYGFCYDDVYDQSSTLQAPFPTKATITIGGFPQASAVAKSNMQSICKSLLRIDPSGTNLQSNRFVFSKLTMFDLSGKQILETSLTKGSAHLAKPLSAGMYLWKLSDGVSVQSGSISVVR